VTTRVFGGANLAWQLGGDARLILELAEKHDALALVECRTKDNEPIDVAAILGPDWWVSQDVTDGATAGTAIAIRKGGKVKRRRIAAAYRAVVRISSGNSRVQSRYLRAAPIRVGWKRATLMAAHIPTRSSGKQDEAIAVVTKVWRSIRGRKLIFMDGNNAPREVAERITAPNFDGNGVMVWAWSKRWASVRVFWHRVKGSDHRTGTARVQA